LLALIHGNGQPALNRQNNLPDNAQA